MVQRYCVIGHCGPQTHQTHVVMYKSVDFDSLNVNCIVTGHVIRVMANLFLYFPCSVTVCG